MTGVELNFSGNITLKQGSNFEVIAEGQQNIIDNIRTDVRNGVWKVDFIKNVRKANGVHVYITMPTLSRVQLNGSGNMKTSNTFDGLNELNAGLSGSGNLSMSVNASSIENRISGSGNVVLKGSADRISIGISGSGNFDARNMESEVCSVRISGSGNARVHANNELDARISGSGDVTYRGNPNVNSSCSGSGKVRSAN